MGSHEVFRSYASPSEWAKCLRHAEGLHLSWRTLPNHLYDVQRYIRHCGEMVQAPWQLARESADCKGKGRVARRALMDLRCKLVKLPYQDGRRTSQGQQSCLPRRNLMRLGDSTDSSLGLFVVLRAGQPGDPAPAGCPKWWAPSLGLGDCLPGGGPRWIPGDRGSRHGHGVRCPGCQSIRL